MKHFYRVTWFELWYDRAGFRHERQAEKDVIARDELDACIKVADGEPLGYGFEAQQVGR
jgi:hypothetical protein